MNILVCGGAGYIGSHMNKMLANLGHSTIVFDNLSTGHESAVKWGQFHKGDLLNTEDIELVFEENDIDVVMHFSAYSLVGESVSDPAKYYRNNLIGTFNLLEVMKKFGIDRFIFSSTVAVYGNPVTEVIDEDHPKQPINPYGRSKWMVEQMLQDAATAYGLNSVSLRYFNAAGADPAGEIGEDHDPETHLIPNILKSVKAGAVHLKIFGDDYETRDGTCVRDYVHVNDLCDAHMKAISYLETHQGAHAFNLGNGTGFTVKEVLSACENVVGKSIHYQQAPRRAGAAAVLVANSARAYGQLGWKPQYDNLQAIVRTAWHWLNTSDAHKVDDHLSLTVPQGQYTEWFCEYYLK